MEIEQILILSRLRQLVRPATVAPAPRFPTLDGKAIGIVCNEKSWP